MGNPPQKKMLIIIFTYKHQPHSHVYEITGNPLESYRDSQQGRNVYPDVN